MIDLLDNLLRHILLAQIAELTDAAQVRFQPPDDKWQDYVLNLTAGGEPANAINVYLVDLRENRKLRSNERVPRLENNVVIEEPRPTCLDCHYLISAWSPATVTPGVEPTIDEHILLYQAAAVLIRSAPFNPSHIYPAGSAALNAWPERFRKEDLPVVVTPAEGFPKLPEFWGTMGVNHRWKPVVYLVVTLPVALSTRDLGYLVTTKITEYRLQGSIEPGEVWIQIGGQVLDATQAPPVPVPRAWVQLETLAGVRLQTTETNDLGRFTFGELRAGSYQLMARVTGRSPLTRVIEIPSPTGEYDLQFS